jgi:ribosomal protein S18 acetylase RimI-like enzyme
MKTCYVDTDHRAIADLVSPGELTRHWTITRINVPEQFRGNGYGSALLDQIIADADAEREVLQLEISPSGGLSFRQLEDWYKRRGFFVTDHGYMKRVPR